MQSILTASMVATIRGVRSDIHCECSKSIAYVTCTIDIEYSQWITERSRATRIWSILRRAVTYNLVVADRCATQEYARNVRLPRVTRRVRELYLVTAPRQEQSSGETGTWSFTAFAHATLDFEIDNELDYVSYVMTWRHVTAALR